MGVNSFGEPRERLGGEEDHGWMRRALALAERARELGEVPVGAVVTRSGEVYGEGWNCPVTTNDPTAHAEIGALRAAAEQLGNYRLPGTTLYVTLEPCPMCVGAMIHARVERLVLGALDPKTGAAGSAYALLQSPWHNHHIAVTTGVLDEACGECLRAFFRARRCVRNQTP